MAALSRFEDEAVLGSLSAEASDADASTSGAPAAERNPGTDPLELSEEEQRQERRAFNRQPLFRPVTITTLDGKGIVDESHPLAIGLQEDDRERMACLAILDSGDLLTPPVQLQARGTRVAWLFTDLHDQFMPGEQQSMAMTRGFGRKADGVICRGADRGEAIGKRPVPGISLRRCHRL